MLFQKRIRPLTWAGVMLAGLSLSGSFGIVLCYTLFCPSLVFPGKQAGKTETYGEIEGGSGKGKGMKFRFLGVSAIALLLGLSIAGCAKKSIVGKWSGDVPLPGSRGTVNAIVEFKPDGTLTSTVSKGGMTVLVQENYTIKDSVITETATSISVNGSTVPLPPQQAQPQTATFNIDSDTLKLTNSRTSQTVTLTRVKS